MELQDAALATLRHIPDPFVLVDDAQQVRFINKAGETLLQCTLDSFPDKSTKAIFNLRDAHELVHGETTASWFNDARLEFHVSEYPIDDHTNWLYLGLRNRQFPSDKKALHRPHPHSEASFNHVKNGVGHQEIPPGDDFWDAQKLEHILERLPTVVAAVSKDGRHVWQNQAAFATLGSIRWSQDELSTWLERQWGSTHGDGTPFKIEEYPIYKTAVLGERVADYETCYEGKSYLFTGAPQYDDQGNHIGGCVFAHDITSTKREGLEKERNALAQSDHKFAAITDNMEQLVWTSDKYGAALYFNKRWYEYTGAGVDASLGMGWYDFVHPDDIASARDNWLIVAPEQDTFISQHRVRAFDGSYRWFLARARCLRNVSGEREKWLGTSTDISDLTSALEEAKSTREHLLSITSAAKVHYFVLEEEGGQLKLTSLFLSGDQGHQRLYGYLDRDSLLNKDVQDVLPASLIAKVRCILSGRHEHETDEILANGNEYWRTQLYPLKKSNDYGQVLSGVVGTAINITQEKIKDQALQRADTARNVAVQSSKFKSEFLARMSHEIRTPIGGILGMAQLLADTPLSAEQRNFLKGISRSGDGLLVIINDILDFSKIEVGKLDIESVPFDLKLVADDVLAGSQYGPHKQHSVQLILDYSVPTDLVLLGDRNRVMQILFNLTSNALKFTHTGSVTIRISMVEAEISDNHNSGSVVIKFEVIDTGLGVPPEILSKLFTPFTQADSSTCRRFGGTGLGLTIARQLATLMSGTLDLTSTGNDGEGAHAICIIPFSLCPRGALRRDSMLPQDINGNGAHVLIVEDNKINQTIATTMLKKLNYNTRVANHGQEALDILHAGASDGSYCPDLVLMDCQMPVLDGYETTKSIRADVIDRLRRIPIIAMTASAIRGDREKCLSCGMDDYVSKPVKQAQLGAILAKWLTDVRLDMSKLQVPLNDSSKKRQRQSFDNYHYNGAADGPS